MSEPVAVRVRDCACPGTPHGEEGDTVLLAPILSLAGGLAARADINRATKPDGTVDAVQLKTFWMETYVKHCALGWNWLDADGDPMPFDVSVLLADYELALPVAEAADDLYEGAVLRPLLARLKPTSRSGRTGSSTSPKNGSTTRQPARSSPASTAAIPPLMP